MPTLERLLPYATDLAALSSSSIWPVWDRQTISDIAGGASFTVWLFAQSPQIIKNYRRSSVQGLSVVFLVQWCLGDLTNLIGCVLTHQLFFQVLVAGYFCLIDIFILGQFTTYTMRAKKRRREAMAANGGAVAIGGESAGHLGTATRHRRRPSMSQSCTSDRLQPLLQAKSYSSIGQTSPLDQYFHRRDRHHSHRTGQRRAQSYSRPRIESRANSHYASATVGKGKQRAMDSSEASRKGDLSASADLGVISRTRERQWTRTDSSDRVPRSAIPNHLLSDLDPQIQEAIERKSRGSSVASSQASRASSPQRGRSVVPTPPVHLDPSVAAAGNEAPQSWQRPPNHRAQGSYRQLTEEALRVALLAEKLDRRSRSRANRSGREGELTPHGSRNGSRATSRAPSSRSRSRRSSIGEAIAPMAPLRRQISDQKIKQVEDTEDSQMTIREGEAHHAANHRVTFAASRSNTANERQPLLSPRLPTESGGEESQHRIRSTDSGHVRNGSLPRRRKRKAAAGFFSLLGMGGLLGVGQLGDDVGLWRQLPVEMTAQTVDSRPLRHPAMMYSSSWTPVEPSPCILDRHEESSVNGTVMCSFIDRETHSNNTSPPRKSRSRKWRDRDDEDDDDDDQDRRHHRHHGSSRLPRPPPGGGPVDLPPASPTMPSWDRLIGRLASWICTILYITSRLPQIWTNFTHRSVEGLSILLFISAFIGNALYSLSVLANPQAIGPGSREYLGESLPFLLGSGGTLVFDFTIMLQYWMYQRKGKRRERTTSSSSGRRRTESHRPATEIEEGQSSRGIEASQEEALAVWNGGTPVALRSPSLNRG